MSESTAWLLSIGPERYTAIGERELLHLVPQPEVFEVPLAPRHCRRVLPWQDRLLPLWDIPAWRGRGVATDNPPVAAIVGYQSQPRETPRLGAVGLIEPPVRITVSDSQACKFPEETPDWKHVAVSCFLHRENPVPILDLYTMFTASPSVFL